MNYLEYLGKIFLENSVQGKLELITGVAMGAFAVIELLQSQFPEGLLALALTAVLFKWSREDLKKARTALDIIRTSNIAITKPEEKKPKE